MVAMVQPESSMPEAATQNETENAAQAEVNKLNNSLEQDVSMTRSDKYFHTLA